MNDRVNQPKHYTSHPSGVECITISQHYNFCVGNAIKYCWRAGLKEEHGSDPVEKQIEDLKKAVWYLNREIKNLEEGAYDGKEKQTKNQGMAKVKIGSESEVHVSGSPEVTKPTYSINDWQGWHPIRYDQKATHGIRGSGTSQKIDTSSYSILPSRFYLRTNY